MPKIDAQKKTLFIFGPYAEFTQFVTFNRTIRNIKKTGEYERVVAVVPYQALAAVSEADAILTVSHEFHQKTKSDYPTILNLPWQSPQYLTPLQQQVLGEPRPDTKRDRLGIYHSGFADEVVGFIKRNYDNSTHEIGFYSHHPGLLEPYFNKWCEKWFHVLPASHPDVSSASGVLRINVPYGEFENAALEQAWQSDDYTSLLPFAEDFVRIQEKFSYMFDTKTYVIHSRNFSNKQHAFYPSNWGIKRHYKEDLLRLMDEGYRIINVGFPPANFDLDHKNYTEFEVCDFSYSEYLSFCRLAAGWCVFPAGAGGYLMHRTSDLSMLWLPHPRNTNSGEIFDMFSKHVPATYNSTSLPSMSERVTVVDRIGK